MGMTEFVDRVTPPWAKSSAVSHWWSMFRFGAVVIDILIEGVYSARRAGLPNQIDVPGIGEWGGYTSAKALTKYLAPDAGVYQGLTESIPDLAQRVRHAQDPTVFAGGWPTAGLVTGVLEQLASVLGPTPPLLRIVNRHGDWWTRYQDGTYELARVLGTGLTWDLAGNATPNGISARPWAWDAPGFAPQPPDAGLTAGAGEWWLITYAPLCPPYGTEPWGLTYNGCGVSNCLNADHAAGAPGIPYSDASTSGSNVSVASGASVFNVIRQRQTLGFECNTWIHAFDPASFAPDGSSSVYPDGSWGEVVKLSGGKWVRTRLTTARYAAIGPSLAPPHRHVGDRYTVPSY